jgi:arylsulfatase A-like enzyme
MRIHRTIVTAGTFALSASLTQCALRPAPPSGLVIITLDTTRADRLPAYGFASVATPSIDTVARRGVVFNDAMTVAPLTLTAHTSLFTGLYPPHHGVRDNTDAPLDPSHATLAGILRARGFRTGAFVGSVVLSADRGLSQGFDVYDDGGTSGGRAPHRRRASEVVDRAAAWICTLRQGEPFFLWVHLYDVHASQTVPLEFRRAYGDRYEGGIAYVDAEIGRLFDVLRQRRLFDEAVVVIAGDHGESLGEHGETAHGLLVYDSTMHVPLIVAARGVSPGRVLAPTSLVDVLPTVCDLLHVAAPAGDGRNLVPAFRGGAVPDRLVYGESMYPRHFGGTPLRTIRDGRFKYIEARRPELYDLQTDPSELHDLSAARPSVMSALAQVLQSTNASDDRGSPANGLDLERRRILAGLGYASGRQPYASGRQP